MREQSHSLGRKCQCVLWGATSTLRVVVLGQGGGENELFSIRRRLLRRSYAGCNEGAKPQPEQKRTILYPPWPQHNNPKKKGQVERTTQPES